MNQYLYEYDNPYKVLAHSIVGSYRPADILRLLFDDEYLLSCIIKEVREQDIRGRFLDCVIEELLTNKRRMEYMHELDKLAKYFYTNVDKERLRSEILIVLEKAGIRLDAYPAAGSVSSLKAYPSPTLLRSEL